MSVQCFGGTNSKPYVGARAIIFCISLYGVSAGGGNVIDGAGATSVGSFGIQFPITIRPPGRVTRTISLTRSPAKATRRPDTSTIGRTKRSM